MRISISSAAAILAAAFSIQTFAEDWPQWGGINRDHVSQEKGLLQKWPDGGPKQVWLNRNAGLGYAGVSVANGKLFTMGAREGMEYLIAIDANTGKELWATEMAPILKNDWGDGPRGTPTVVGNRVYALAGRGTLIAANVADGKMIWRKTMQELGGEVPNWGYTESVLVRDGKVYCTPGSDRGTIAALSADNGELVWQSSDMKVPAHYSSIVHGKINGEDQLVQLTEKKLFAVNPKDGKVLWESDWSGRVAVIPTPIIKDNYVYVTAGYEAGCKLLKINPGNKPEEVYQNKVLANHHGGVVLVDGHVYGHSDRPANGWICQNFMTGEEVWKDTSFGKGAVTFAGGRLYCLEEGSGEVALVEASPEGWREHGRFKLEPQTKQRAPRGRIWMHPVIANGKLYLRDQELLFCFDVSAK